MEVENKLEYKNNSEDINNINNKKEDEKLNEKINMNKTFKEVETLNNPVTKYTNEKYVPFKIKVTQQNAGSNVLKELSKIYEHEN